MRNRPLQDIKDKSLREHLRFMQEFAADKEIKEVTSEPTTTSLPPGERQIYESRGNKYIYENIGGNLYRYQLTAV